jgi:hypothetical protein
VKFPIKPCPIRVERVFVRALIIETSNTIFEKKPVLGLFAGSLFIF